MGVTATVAAVVTPPGGRNGERVRNRERGMVRCRRGAPSPLLSPGEGGAAPELRRLAARSPRRRAEGESLREGRGRHRASSRRHHRQPWRREKRRARAKIRAGELPPGFCRRHLASAGEHDERERSGRERRLARESPREGVRRRVPLLAPPPSTLPAASRRSQRREGEPPRSCCRRRVAGLAVVVLALLLRHRSSMPPLLPPGTPRPVRV